MERRDRGKRKQTDSQANRVGLERWKIWFADDSCASPSWTLVRSRERHVAAVFFCWETNVATSRTSTPPLAGRHRDCWALSRAQGRIFYWQARKGRSLRVSPSRSCLWLTEEWFNNQWKVTLPFPVSHSCLDRPQTEMEICRFTWVAIACNGKLIFNKLRDLMADLWIKGTVRQDKRRRTSQGQTSVFLKTVADGGREELEEFSGQLSLQTVWSVAQTYWWSTRDWKNAGH